MRPVGAHLAFDPALSGPERWYLRLFGPPEPSLRIRTGHVLRAVDRLAPARILDAGSGAGFTAIPLAQRHSGSSVVAIDVDGAAIAHGRELARAAGVHNVTFLEADAMSYEPAEPFDAVVCVDALEYVPDDQAFLQRVRSWLTPSGSLVLHCRADPTPYRRAAFKRAPSSRDGRVRTGYSLDALRAMLAAAGFATSSLEQTLTAPAELAYELADPELGVFKSRPARAIAAPPLQLFAQLDRLGIGRGAGILAVASAGERTQLG